MSQLLEFKIKPFEAVRFRQQARLISEDTLAIEKQRALARRVVFTQNANAGSGADMKYINKVNRTFSSVASQTAQKVPLTATGSAQIPAPGIRSIFRDFSGNLFRFRCFCRTTGNLYTTTGDTGSPGSIWRCGLYSGD